MDLAVSAKSTWVMMSFFTKDDSPKLVANCRYPLTGLRCVSRVYTDCDTFVITDSGVKVIDLVPGLSIDSLQLALGLPLEVFGCQD